VSCISTKLSQAMPTGIDRVDQLPLPSLQWYAGFSGLALFYALVYALATPEGLFHTLRSDVWCEAVSLICPLGRVREDTFELVPCSKTYLAGVSSYLSTTQNFPHCI